MYTYNFRGEHHGQFADRVKPSRICNANDGNFGGSCFNCGFSPSQESPKLWEEAQEDDHILELAELYEPY